MVVTRREALVVALSAVAIWLIARYRQRQLDARVQAVIEERTRAFVSAVQSRGDAALLEFTARFDGATLTGLVLK